MLGDIIPVVLAVCVLHWFSTQVPEHSVHGVPRVYGRLPLMLPLKSIKGQFNNYGTENLVSSLPVHMAYPGP